MIIPTVFSHVNDPELSQALWRFLCKIEDYSSETACWNWIGAKRWDGYGSFSFRGRKWQAHNWAYWLKYGYLTAELQRDHLCKNKGCANPLHLEEVDQPTNALRGELYNRNKTHCKRGHAYDEANTCYSMEYGKMRRHCRACDRARWRAKQARLKISS